MSLVTKMTNVEPIHADVEKLLLNDIIATPKKIKTHKRILN
jgi:hypothetical protein